LSQITEGIKTVAHSYRAAFIAGDNARFAYDKIVIVRLWLFILAELILFT